MHCSVRGSLKGVTIYRKPFVQKTITVKKLRRNTKQINLCRKNNRNTMSKYIYRYIPLLAIIIA